MTVNIAMALLSMSCLQELLCTKTTVSALCKMLESASEFIAKKHRVLPTLVSHLNQMYLINSFSHFTKREELLSQS